MCRVRTVERLKRPKIIDSPGIASIPLKHAPEERFGAFVRIDCCLQVQFLIDAVDFNRINLRNTWQDGGCILQSRCGSFEYTNLQFTHRQQRANFAVKFLGGKSFPDVYFELSFMYIRRRLNYIRKLSGTRPREIFYGNTIFTSTQTVFLHKKKVVGIVYCEVSELLWRGDLFRRDLFRFILWTIYSWIESYRNNDNLLEEAWIKHTEQVSTQRVVKKQSKSNVLVA